MPDLLVRDIPQEVKTWLDARADVLQQSRKELVIDVLQRAYHIEQEPSLFDGVSRVHTPAEVTGLPFTFIDLFAGIGGLRLGLEKNGGRCMFSCEWNNFARKTYRAWFGEMPAGDIRELDPGDVPDHDVLAAGFPCQPFSIAGVSKKTSLGMEHGFRDVTQGTLFFHLAKVIEAKQPPAILLENVKNLRSHDKGRTWAVIRRTLEDLGYVIHDKVIDAAAWVPQHRERIFIVGFHRRVFGDNPAFEFPEPPSGPAPKFRDILDPDTPETHFLTHPLWRAAA